MSSRDSGLGYRLPEPHAVRGAVEAHGRGVDHRGVQGVDVHAGALSMPSGRPRTTCPASSAAHCATLARCATPTLRSYPFEVAPPPDLRGCGIKPRKTQRREQEDDECGPRFNEAAA